MRRVDRIHRLKDRIKHPWPVWKRAGGIEVTVIRADGRIEKLGTVSDVYTKRWKARANGNGSS